MLSLNELLSNLIDSMVGIIILPYPFIYWYYTEIQKSIPLLSTISTLLPNTAIKIATNLDWGNKVGDAKQKLFAKHF